MKGIRFIYTTLALAIAAAGGVHAQNVDIWFGDSAGNPVNSIDVAPGSTFGVSIWYQTSDTWAHNAIELLVGFDQATSDGTTAVPIDGKISLASVSNIGFPIVLANKVGGGFSPTSGSRPYGAHLALGAALGTTVTATSPVRIADINLKNYAIPAGSSYDIAIWNAVDGFRWTSYVPMSSSVRRDASSATLKVNSIQDTAQEYSIDQFKKLANGQRGKLVDAEVTTDVGDSFFVETTNRSAGIRVAKLGSEVYTPGVKATITGTIETNSNGERYIVSSTISSASGSKTVFPLGMVNGALGGSGFGYNNTTGAGQAGVTNGNDLNNIGLLVRTWGKPVLTGSSDSFKVEDGSGTDVIVQLPEGQIHGWTSANLPTYVTVTGASGLKKSDSVTLSAIYISSFSNDVKLVQ